MRSQTAVCLEQGVAFLEASNVMRRRERLLQELSGRFSVNFAIRVLFQQIHTTIAWLQVKSLNKDSSSISVAPPKTYARRFFDFVASRVFFDKSMEEVRELQQRTGRL